jgi:RecB family exonuclease
VHDVLETFFGQHLGRSPDPPWTQEERAAAHELLDQRAHRLAQEGKAGQPLVWQHRMRTLHRALRATLDWDDARRQELRATPIALEQTFGLDEDLDDALRVELSNGTTLSLHGAVDRVDRHEDGTLSLIDWKTGGTKKYDEMAKSEDLVDRGRRLQLPLYAAAIQAKYDVTTDVEAYYVFVEHNAHTVGGRVDDAQRARLQQALDALTGGINDGLFPVMPGEFGYFGWDNCGFCAYARVCPSERGIQSERAVQHPDLAAYVALTELEGTP